MDVVAVSHPKRFEVYWVCLDPTVGSEIRKTRPGVVLSPDELNSALRTVLVAPLTSAVRPYPFRPTVEVEGKSGQIALDQLRVLDKSRLGRRLATLTPAEQDAALDILREMFAR